MAGDLDLVTSKRVSPVDLSYEPGINPNDVGNCFEENCTSYFLSSYSDVIGDFTSGQIPVERTWSLLNTMKGVEYSCNQRINILNPYPKRKCYRFVSDNSMAMH
ncbi:MAG: hypothetical protein IPN10_08605 [Saprospiraceae bacterium]|nr:hypothetical protein [Saprospiraceae bacterium]